jgi:hypothetical protein
MLYFKCDHSLNLFLLSHFYFLGYLSDLYKKARNISTISKINKNINGRFVVKREKTISKNQIYIYMLKIFQIL